MAKAVRAQLRDMPNGPIPQDHKTVRGTECDHCHEFWKSDIYIHNGLILCGACRYKHRTGRWPEAKPSYGIGSPLHDKTYHGDGGNHSDQEWWAMQIGG